MWEAPATRAWRICSRHFTEKDFNANGFDFEKDVGKAESKASVLEQDYKPRRRLSYGAVPTLFLVESRWISGRFQGERTANK